MRSFACWPLTPWCCWRRACCSTTTCGRTDALARCTAGVDRRMDRGGIPVGAARADPGRDHPRALLPHSRRVGDGAGAGVVDGEQSALPAYSQPRARPPGCRGGRDRIVVLRGRDRQRIAMGQGDVGRLLELGPARDLDLLSAADLRRLPRVARGHRLAGAPGPPLRNLLGDCICLGAVPDLRGATDLFQFAPRSDHQSQGQNRHGFAHPGGILRLVAGVLRVVLLGTVVAGTGGSARAQGRGAAGGPHMKGDLVVMAVALLVWGLLFWYLIRLERRVVDLEKR